MKLSTDGAPYWMVGILLSKSCMKPTLSLIADFLSRMILVFSKVT